MSKNGPESRPKVWAAKWYYRWSTSQGILGAVFSALTFVGVFTLLFGPVLQQFGIGYSSTLFILLGIVVVLFFGFGFILDRVIRFWTAQTLVSTVRNPFLKDRLYQKEMLAMKVKDIPMLKAVRALLDLHEIDFRTPEEREKRRLEAIVALDQAIERFEQTVKDHRWTVGPEEGAYEDSD